MAKGGRTEESKADYRRPRVLPDVIGARLFEKPQMPEMLPKAPSELKVVALRLVTASGHRLLVDIVIFTLIYEDNYQREFTRNML